MKKTAALLMAVLLSTGLVACGTDQEGDASQMPSETAQTTQEAPQTGSQALPDDPQQPTAGSPADGTQQAESEQTENTQTESQTATEEQSGYEDNFAVDSIAAAEFADKIKTAVAAKDLEALADLTSYPVYVGIAESSVSSREELIELGADNVFTEELMTAVAEADTSALSPSMAGFVLSNGGTANIVFGVVDGELAIQGINY